MAIKAKKKVAKKAIKQKEKKSREFRVEYTFVTKDLEVVLIRAATKYDAMIKFFHTRCSCKIGSVREVADVERLKQELADAKAKIKKGQKRKKPASRKKAKTSKKS